MTTGSLGNLERALGQSKGKGADSAPRPGGPQMCGDIDIRIARDGTWHYMGSPIGRMPLVKLFASVLERDESGDFWLITPAEMCRIRVDDAPFVAVDMTVEGSGRDRRVGFRTNLDENVIAGRDHPIRVDIDPDTSEPAPYVLVRDGLEALISRSVFYDLVEIAEETEIDGAAALGIWSDGQFFAIGTI
jgi:hypothetical protein